jgi:hypothetical protein
MSHILPRFLIPSLTVAVLGLGAAWQTQDASADSGNQKTITQFAAAIPGTETASGSGNAIVGTTTTYSHAVVQQHNVQVAAGDPAALSASSQDAFNTATVGQTDVAMSGNATADGGTATSGDATAGSLAVVLQLNVQVMALLSPECVAAQTATNDAQIDQTAVAATGEASSEGGDAASGDASASNKAVLVQRNLQVYVCKPKSGTSTTQDAAQTYVLDQAAVSASGSADGGAAGDSTSGNVASSNSSRAGQVTRQIVIE